MREDGSRILPILALNEVFIGESLSSRVSYLELQVIVCCSPKLFAVNFFCDNMCAKVDQQQQFKTRNSGLCIATGTGEGDFSSFDINLSSRIHQCRFVKFSKFRIVIHLSLIKTLQICRSFRFYQLDLQCEQDGTSCC